MSDTLLSLESRFAEVETEHVYSLQQSILEMDSISESASTNLVGIEGVEGMRNMSDIPTLHWNSDSLNHVKVGILPLGPPLHLMSHLPVEIPCS